MTDLPPHRCQVGVGVVHLQQGPPERLDVIGGDDEPGVVIPDKLDTGSAILAADHGEPGRGGLDDHLPPRLEPAGKDEHPRPAELLAEVRWLEEATVFDPFDPSKEWFERPGAAGCQRPWVSDALAVGAVRRDERVDRLGGHVAPDEKESLRPCDVGKSRFSRPPEAVVVDPEEEPGDLAAGHPPAPHHLVAPFPRHIEGIYPLQKPADPQRRQSLPPGEQQRRVGVHDKLGAAEPRFVEQAHVGAVGPSREHDDVGLRGGDDIPDDGGVVPLRLGEGPWCDLAEERRIERSDRRRGPMDEGDIHPWSTGKLIDAGGEVS